MINSLGTRFKTYRWVGGDTSSSEIFDSARGLACERRTPWIEGADASLERSDQPGFSTIRSARILEFAKFVIRAVIWFLRPFIDSVGRFVTNAVSPVVSIGPGSHRARISSCRARSRLLSSSISAGHSLSAKSPMLVSR